MKIRDIHVIRKENKNMQDVKNNSVKTAIILSILLFLALFIISFGKQILVWAITSIPVKQQPVVIINPVKDALKLFNFTYTWESVNFDKDKNLYVNLNLTNNYTKNIKNLEITCIPNYETNVVNKLKVTIFDTIPPNSTKNILHYNFGAINSTKKVECNITDLIVE